MPKSTYNTREEWLQAATLLLAPRLTKWAKKLPKIEAVTSWPFGSSSAIGQTFAKQWTKEGKIYVMISPALGDDVPRVLDVLLHELIHVVLYEDDGHTGRHGHGDKFKEISDELGLEGPVTATHAGDKLKIELSALAKKLGAYPHFTMQLRTRGGEVWTPGKGKGECPDNPFKRVPNPEKKRTQVKYVSPANPKYVAWLSPAMVEEFGAPICPIAKKPMVEVERAEAA